jgi:hypothetical protein
MTTQAELDDMIAKARAALYAINPAYVPDYIPESKKPLRNCQQTDWTGEQPVHDVSVPCSFCNGVMPFTFGVGRPAFYCSDACKMKAYRKRKKALRMQHQTEQKPLRNSNTALSSMSSGTQWASYD